MFARSVYRIYDRLIRPPDYKRLICVCPEDRLFLRINSRPIWRPHHLIFAVNTDFLDHDSYVELRNLIQRPRAECDQAEELGRLTPALARELMKQVEEADTLPQRHKDIVRERWGF